MTDAAPKPTVPIIEVLAWRRARQWYYSPVYLCDWCNKRHPAHGGGNGSVPDLAIGGSGDWVTHCLHPDHPGTERCTLAYIDEGWRP